jgi:hypothetical protein
MTQDYFYIYIFTNIQVLSPTVVIFDWYNKYMLNAHAYCIGTQNDTLPGKRMKTLPVPLRHRYYILRSAVRLMTLEKNYMEPGTMLPYRDQNCL